MFRNVLKDAAEFKNLPNWEKRDYSIKEVDDVLSYAGQQTGLNLSLRHCNLPGNVAGAFFHAVSTALSAGYVAGYKAAKKDLRKAAKAKGGAA